MADTTIEDPIFTRFNAEESPAALGEEFEELRRRMEQQWEACGWAG